MALNPATASTPIATAYLAYVETIEPVGDFQQVFADSYHAYSIEGVLSGGGGGPGSEDPSIISNFMHGLTGNTTVHDFAVMFSTYWSTCLLIPSGGAVSVVNDAASKVSAFEDAIAITLTQSDTKPYFRTLIENIQDYALPEITWTVTLPDSTRNETVS